MVQKRVAITTGDIDGIGLEISIKALEALGPQKNIQFFVYTHSDFKLKSLHRFRINEVEDPSTIAKMSFDPETIIEVSQPNSPAKWVFDATQACVENFFSALVTAPLSKTEIASAGHQLLGHTEIFKSVSGIEDLYMAFIGSQFNIFLMTDHIPLSTVSKKISQDHFLKGLNLAMHFHKNFSTKKLAFLGLNPHAGESGLLGQEEIFLSKWAELFAKEYNVEVVGPLVPDAAFLSKNLEQIGTYVCQYHDQGLIPFKMAHGQDSGIQLTLGLPFIRTSVDHGTAKDLFGQNKANPNSMSLAIKYAIDLLKRGFSSTIFEKKETP